MSILNSLINPVTVLLKEIIPDTDKRAQLAHDIATMAEKHSQQQILAQLEINKKEAEHPSMFVSGWRPACGWICVSGLGFNFILIPFVNLGLELLESPTTIPLIDMETLLPVLLGMLGLGAMRTVEKVKKVERT